MVTRTSVARDLLHSDRLILFANLAKMTGIVYKITLAKYSNNARKLKKTVAARRQERERRDQELWEKYRSKQPMSDATEDDMDLFLSEVEEHRREIVNEGNTPGEYEQTKVLNQNNHM